jgi:hypothetical protein
MQSAILHKPVFICGLRKSGTSMVRLLFDGHPQLYVAPPNEMKFFHYTTIPAMESYKETTFDSAEAIKEHLLDDIMINVLGSGDTNFHRDSFDLDGFKRTMRAKRHADLKELITDMMRAFAQHSQSFTGDVDTTRFVWKGEMQTEYFLEKRAMFPDLKCIYVLRNPYGHFNAVRNSYRTDSKRARGQVIFDNSLSWRERYPFLINHIMYMKTSYTLMDKFATLFPESFRIMIYDDLLRDPEKEMRSVCGFLDIPFHEALLTPTLLGEPWGGNSMVQDREFKGIDKKPLDHWKKSITKNEIRLINTHFSWVFEKYGFERIESNASIYKPFHYTEFFKRYVANRVAFFLR